VERGKVYKRMESLVKEKKKREGNPKSRKGKGGGRTLQVCAPRRSRGILKVGEKGGLGQTKKKQCMRRETWGGGGREGEPGREKEVEGRFGGPR